MQLLTLSLLVAVTMTAVVYGDTDSGANDNEARGNEADGNEADGNEADGNEADGNEDGSTEDSLDSDSDEAAGNGIDYSSSFKEVRQSPELLNGLQIIRTVSGVSTQADCASECGNENTCAAFALGTDSCVLLTDDPFGTDPFVLTSGFKLFAYIGGTLSVLAYRVPSGVGGDALSAYNDNGFLSTDAETKAAVDLDTPLTAVYKNAILDNWNAFDVVEVSTEFKRSDNTLGKVVYNAESSTNKFDWMKQENLLSSPWSDLTTTSAHSNFGVVGPGDVTRRFYINRHLGCPSDIGHLMLITPADDTCSWGNVAAGLVNPEIVYAPGSTGTLMNDQVYGKASEFTVVMKVRCP